MFEELKKRSIKKRLFPAIVLLIIGVVALVFLFPSLMEVLKGSVAFETLKPYEIEEKMLVDVSLKENFGCYMTEYE